MGTRQCSDRKATVREGQRRTGALAELRVGKPGLRPPLGPKIFTKPKGSVNVRDHLPSFDLSFGTLNWRRKTSRQLALRVAGARSRSRRWSPPVQRWTYDR